MHVVTYTRGSSEDSRAYRIDRILDAQPDHEQYTSVTRFGDGQAGSADPRHPQRKAMVAACEGGQFDLLVVNTLWDLHAPGTDADVNTLVALLHRGDLDEIRFADGTSWVATDPATVAAERFLGDADEVVAAMEVLRQAAPDRFLDAAAELYRAVVGDVAARRARGAHVDSADDLVVEHDSDPASTDSLRG